MRWCKPFTLQNLPAPDAEPLFSEPERLCCIVSDYSEELGQPLRRGATTEDVVNFSFQDKSGQRLDVLAEALGATNLMDEE